MARKPRVEFEGALCHVIVRGNHRRDIFRDQSDHGLTKGTGYFSVEGLTWRVLEAFRAENF
jgi:hypothetical protein